VARPVVIGSMNGGPRYFDDNRGNDPIAATAGLNDIMRLTTAAPIEGPAVKFKSYLDGSTIGPWNALAAVLIAVVSFFAWRIARKASLRLLANLSGISQPVRLVISRIVGYVVLLTGLGAALAVLGAPLEPVLTVSFLIIAVLALALRGIADNFAAGVVIQTRKPIHLGDSIKTNGYVGIVKEVNGRAVVIECTDGRTVHIPNALVLTTPIVNETTHGTLRSDLEVRVAGGPQQVQEVCALIVAAASKAPGVRDDPGPYIRIQSIEPDRFIVLLRFWYPWPSTRKVTGDVIAAVASQLREAGRRATVTVPGLFPPLPPSPPV
jgi:small conductance mechanosensitive channel